LTDNGNKKFGKDSLLPFAQLRKKKKNIEQIADLNIATASKRFILRLF
jgi:hypothetical protein